MTAVSAAKTVRCTAPQHAGPSTRPHARLRKRVGQIQMRRGVCWADPHSGLKGADGSHKVTLLIEGRAEIDVESTLIPERKSSAAVVSGFFEAACSQQRDGVGIVSLVVARVHRRGLVKFGERLRQLPLPLEPKPHLNQALILLRRGCSDRRRRRRERRGPEQAPTKRVGALAQGFFQGGRTCRCSTVSWPIVMHL